MLSSGYQFSWTRTLWSLAGVITLVVVCLVLTSCVSAGHHSAPASALPAPNPSMHQTAAPAPPPETTTAPGSAPAGAATPLAAEFTKLEKNLHATMGVVISAVGANPKPLVFGDWVSGPAWSTAKVPVTITALREESPPTVP